MGVSANREVRKPDRASRDQRAPSQARAGRCFAPKPEKGFG
ncbi:hypothetical protein [Oricola indica]|nr:hypothetical protein [Oricola indica]